MHANQYRLAAIDVSFDERHVLEPVDFITVDDCPVHAAMNRGKFFFSNPPHQAFVAQTVCDQTRHCDALQVLLLTQSFQLRQQSYRAIICEDLTNHSCWFEAGQAGEVHRGVGSSGARQYATAARLKWL